ncbi:MAG: helix-turn-helix transcriptional regulator [Lachnospiraceae bacterium]|nr:helix-turn-helix transcriptional regulator [Lachnospiraceae bacterium]
MKTRIKELRLEKKLTQQALAKHLGINQTSLSKIECGVSTPDALLLVDLSRFFHVTTDYILLLSEERLTADHLLENNLHHLKKYQRFITICQMMNQKQQGDCYNFLCSMLGVNDTPGV